MYYIKLKGCYDARGFIDIRVAITFFTWVCICGYQDFSSEITLDCLYLPWLTRLWKSLNKFFVSILDDFGIMFLWVKDSK